MQAQTYLSAPLRRWFADHFGRPTPAQCLAWPALAAGKNLLLDAPTGSGKTLAVFVPVLNRLLHEQFSSSIRCLYVAPLKALVNDVHRSLRAHVSRMVPYLAETSTDTLPLRLVRFALRTGDTSMSERRRQHKRAPDVLLTTPESLAVLLSQPSCGGLFAHLRWVIVDEIHALAGNKRGADLALSLERLSDLAGAALQRVGLSATCAPLAEMGRYLVGEGRACTVAHVAEANPLDLRVEPLPEAGGFLAGLMARLEREVRANRSTLVFTNTRGLAERLTWALRGRYPTWQDAIAVYHSALAAPRRRVVESRLRRGRLRIVVATTSLELGIDVGSVDGVVLVHPPGQVIRLLQRLGRSGHQPGRPRRGLVLTASSAELLEAVVTACACRGEPEGMPGPQQEALRISDHPLDVLCQQLLGMATQRTWSAAEAFDLVRRAYPYQKLPRADFDACLAYLSGRHTGAKDWLPARLRWDADRFAIADARTARILRRNIGTILDEETRDVVLSPDGATDAVKPLGRLAEAFADRLRPGDRFLLDGRCLEVSETAAASLLVSEVVGRPAVPRWGADGWPLSSELARRLSSLRVKAAEALRDGPGALGTLLRREYGLDDRAAGMLAEYFERQERVSEIPDSATCLVEVIEDGSRTDYYVHTPLNQRGNDALARVAALRLARDRGLNVTSVVADLGFGLFAGGPGHARLTVDELRTTLSARSFEADLDAAVRDSTSLRERFRRTALTGLMLLRNPLGRRRRVGGPVWAERRLFEKVAGSDPDFVLLRQALREVREEACDVFEALRFLAELDGCAFRLRRLSAPSPFAEGWTQVAAGPVASAESPSEALEHLHALLTGAAPQGRYS